MSDDYWDEQCLSCGKGVRHTNYECVVEIAEATKTPLEQALKVFRKPEQQRPPFMPAPTEATDWSGYRTRYLYESGKEPE